MAIKLSGSTIIDDSRNIVNAGIVTATSFDGDGSGLSGIVTSITAGTGITISGSTGNVTINASGGGSGIGLTDFSVTTATASGGGSLSYDDATGVFSYTPPDLSSYLTSVTASDLSAISIDALSDVDTTTAAPTDGQALLWNNSNSKWEPGTVSSGGGGTTTFLGLTDTPSTFLAYKYLAVNSAGNAVEFVDAPSGGSGAGATTFLALNDTPASFGTAGQVLAVNSAADGLEFVAASSGGGGGTSLTVQTRNGSSGAEGNEATAISKITFNSASGFSVSEPNTGEAFISLGSAFAPWSVSGQTTLTPEGEEEIEFIAGSGITITTNNSSTPKSITFTASGGGGGGGSVSNLSDIGDVADYSSAANNSVLKWNATAGTWYAGTDATGSGGGGGGGSGDGTAPLGANSRVDPVTFTNTYEGGLLGLTNTTQINDAIDGLNQIMTKLAPPAPPNLSSKTLSVTKYSAYVSGTNPPELRTDVVNTTQPQTAVVSNFFDGANGTLSFEVDGQVDGSIDLGEGSNVGTDAGLTITADNDPYQGQSGSANFWEQLSARGQSTTALTAGAEHTYQLKHTTTGNTNLLTFYVDSPGSPSVGSVTHDSSNAVANKSYVSGVPTYNTSIPILMSGTVSGAISKAYNSTKIADITGTNVNTATVPPDSGGYSEGDDASFVDYELYFKNNTFSDSDITVSVKGYDSKGTPGSTTSHTIPGRVDTKSDETSRKTSGSGQYPAANYGNVYNSQDSLATNEELQMLNNKFVYPTADYSANHLAGPDYSSLSGWRYVTFQVTGPSNKGVATLNITGTGLSQGPDGPFQTVDNLGFPIRIQMYFTSTTGAWHDCNGPWNPSGVESTDGFLAVNAATTTNHLSKKLTLGNFYTTAIAYVRIGLNAGSTATISGVNVSY